MNIQPEDIDLSPGASPRSGERKGTPPSVPDEAPKPHQNPYHPFLEPERYCAFRDGWVAQRTGADAGHCLGDDTECLRSGTTAAWLDGWTTAHRTARGAGAGACCTEAVTVWKT